MTLTLDRAIERRGASNDDRGQDGVRHGGVIDAASATSTDGCKICGSTTLEVFAHTARCSACGVLLYWPYPNHDQRPVSDERGSQSSRDAAFEWYSKSSFYNHANFTRMLRFAMDESFKSKKIDVLDYGGGGGQFALVCRSHFPEALVYVTDIDDASLLDEWQGVNVQIRFAEFAWDQRRFDVIFLNDVFEHVADPGGVLRVLTAKLKPGGILFIDTPKQFWIYPLTKLLSPSLYRKVLRGTVSAAHLQIWSRRSFEYIVEKTGLEIVKYSEESEYTMPPDFYLKNMGITSPWIRLAGRCFYRNARYLAKNKIMCVLRAKSTTP